MNFNEIKNRLLIGALAITVFPFMFMLKTIRWKDKQHIEPKPGK